MNGMGTTARDIGMDISEDEDEKDKRQLVELRDGEVYRCRICARSLPTGTREAAAAARIFAEEGRRRNLQRHIQKYLCITVSSEDKLPKMVCASCIGKLDGIHAFATMALRSQERLKQELERTPADSAVTVDSSDSSDSFATKLGNRGLLHSILTKGSVETSNDGEPVVQGRQRTPSTEEMEVKVDPMLFLQCALEQTSSADYSDFSDDNSDREISSYCSPASEPLSLTNNFDKCNRRVHEKKEKECRTASEVQKSRDSNDNEDLDNMDNSKDNESDEEDEFEEGEDHHSDSKPKTHVCKICTRAFTSQIALQNHLWSHLPTTTSSDIRGSYTDKAPSVLRAQQQLSDTTNGLGSQNNSCSENSLLSGSFICPICGKKISTKGNLKVHLETHRPKGKYGCDICGRIFKTQSNLFRHKEYHSGIQFPCSVCGRVYPTNSTLRAHSITHSDLRPHACPLCDKTFKRNQDLKFHINQHTGARPYQCPYCPKAFASSGNCFSHRKRMHPKEVHRDRQRAADLMR